MEAIPVPARRDRLPEFRIVSAQMGGRDPRKGKLPESRSIHKITSPGQPHQDCGRTRVAALAGHRVYLPGAEVESGNERIEERRLSNAGMAGEDRHPGEEFST